MKNLKHGVMKTAIDWLIEQYIEKLTITPAMINQAKLIEKEQIIKSHKDAYLICGFEHSAEDCSNEYYFETYEDKRSNTND